MVDEPTELESLKRRLLNRKWIAIPVLIFIIILGVGSLTDSLTKISSFFGTIGEPRASNNEKGGKEKIDLIIDSTRKVKVIDIELEDFRELRNINTLLTRVSTKIPYGFYGHLNKQYGHNNPEVNKVDLKKIITIFNGI